MSINADKNRLVARNTLFLYLRMGVVLILSLYTTRVLLQVLGVEDYGIYNVVAGVVSLFGFLNVSLSASIQRFYNYEGGINGIHGWQRVYVTSICIELIFALIILILLETVGLWYVTNKLVVPPERMYAAKFLFHLTCFQMVVVMLQAPFAAMIMAKEKMSYYAFVSVVEVAFKLGLVLLLPYISSDKLVVYGIFNVVLALVVFFLYYGYVRIKYSECRFNLQYDASLFRSLLSFSGWNILGAAAMIIRTQGVNMLLNLFWGPVVNSARGIAFQIQSAVMGFTQNLTIAVRPQMTEAYAKSDIIRTQNFMYSVSKVSFVLLYILVLPVIFQADTILKLWIGESVPEYTSPFIKLILIASLIDVLNSPVTIVMMASGKVKCYSLITSLIGILILPISYIMLKMGNSPNVVFIIGIFVSVAVQVASLFTMHRQLGFSIYLYLKKIILPLCLLVATTFWIPFIINIIPLNEYGKLALVCLVSIMSILLFSYYVVFNHSERKNILNFIKR